MTNLRSALERAVDELPAGLRDHVRRVVADAQRLARIHGVDVERATIAALGHDLARAEQPAELVRQAEVAGLAIDDVERSQPILLHGAVSAHLMAEGYAVTDAEVLAAARHHTTARAGMGALEKLIFVADKTEPEKARGALELAEARRLADGSLDAAMRAILDWQVARAIEEGWPLHPDTIAARNELVG